MGKKETTLDDVVNMVGTGFRELRVELVTRMDGLEAQMNGFEKRMDSFEKRMNTLDEKIDIVNANVKSLSFDYQKVLDRVRNLEVRTFGSVQE